MRSTLAASAQRTQVPRVVPPPTGPQRGSEDDALALIFAPLRRGDGYRHGALGAPGFGKTHHLRRVISAALERRLVDLVVTHDTKHREPDYPGTCVPYVADVAGVTAELERTRHVVFRGDPRRDEKCSAEDVAMYARRISRDAAGDGIAVLLNIGELDECLSEGGRSFDAPSVRWFSSQGRQLRACLVWTQQQPKRCPDEFFDQSTTLALFHLDERSANYLGGVLMFDPDLVAILPRLDPHEFVIRQPGVDWNRRVYRHAA